MLKQKIAFACIGIILSSFCVNEVALAQIRPERTLGRQRSLVLRNQRIRGIRSDRIDGGARRGRSLFHSFREFNVKQGRGVYFNNYPGVKNIFTRITGNNPSRIFGTLGVIKDGSVRVLGDANLFFINPNGIIFGKGARLDLNGSFVGTTASSLVFNNGFEFSATNPRNIPIEIKTNFPIGFGFGEQPGNILVQGNGNTLIGDENFRVKSLFQETNEQEGLKIASGNLALIGGNILFEGGILRTETGNIELASILNSGVVSLSPELNFNYQEVSKFGKIELLNRSLIKSESGSILIQGNDVSLEKGSFVWLFNNHKNRSGNISINAESLLELNNNIDFPAAIIAGLFHSKYL